MQEELQYDGATDGCDIFDSGRVPGVGPGPVFRSPLERAVVSLALGQYGKES